MIDVERRRPPTRSRRGRDPVSNDRAQTIDDRNPAHDDHVPADRPAVRAGSVRSTGIVHSDTGAAPGSARLSGTPYREFNEPITTPLGDEGVDRDDPSEARSRTT